MTSLDEIRDISTRLHAHIFDWTDRDLQDDLLWILDELQEIHACLDRLDVPVAEPVNHLPLSLKSRVQAAIHGLGSQIAPLSSSPSRPSHHAASLPPGQLTFPLQGGSA